MINRRNYYRILHVQSDAPDDVIRASYRVQMQKLKLHPDLGGNDWNATVLNEAYAALSSKQKRASYDQHLQNSLPPDADNRQAFKNHPEPGIAPILHIARDLQCLFCGAEITDITQQYNSNECTACNSPLKSSTSHLHHIDTSDRALDRHSKNAPVKYFTKAKNPAQFGVLRDLSPLGLQFQLSEPLENDQIIKLVCDDLTAIAKVRNCREGLDDGLYIVGVEFITSRFTDRLGTFFSEAVC